MTRGFQFSLKALLVATSFVAAGTLLGRLAVEYPDGGNANAAIGAISCFGAAIGSFTRRPPIGIAIGLLAGPVFGFAALIYMAACMLLYY